MYLDWLADMAKKHKGKAAAYAATRGMTIVSSVALIQKGDTRLLLAQKGSEETGAKEE
jgi:hypothetical protein